MESLQCACERLDKKVLPVKKCLRQLCLYHNKISKLHVAVKTILRYDTDNKHLVHGVHIISSTSVFVSKGSD